MFYGFNFDVSINNTKIKFVKNNSEYNFQSWTCSRSASLKIIYKDGEIILKMVLVYKNGTRKYLSSTRKKLNITVDRDVNVALL